ADKEDEPERHGERSQPTVEQAGACGAAIWRGRREPWRLCAGSARRCPQVMHVTYLSNAARTAQRLHPILGAQPIAELSLGIQKQRLGDTLGRRDRPPDPPVRCDTM